LKRTDERIAAITAEAMLAERRVLSPWLELTKPRIGVFVIFAAMVGGVLASGAQPDFVRVAVAGLLVGCVAASSCVFNHIIERDLDRLMERTAKRPLVTGRIGVRDAVFFGSALALVGTVGLALYFGMLAALLGLATLLAYALVYTPLKRHTSLNTVVGALPGAMPPLLGYVAIAGDLGPWAFMLFGILFAWQFPHFFAIAWLHREDYRRAGMQMLPAMPNSEGDAGQQSLLYGLVLLPVSMMPFWHGEAGFFYALVAALAGVVYVGASFAFSRRENPKTARRLLYVSLVYLPVVLCGAMARPLWDLVA
jgi:protoheme IX farnesyltransferase